jgi:ADP-ribosylglycohydrolase
MQIASSVACFGGAVGDALGAAVEFSSLEAIRAEFGPEGLRDHAASYGRSHGAVTDDTQMALFTAEGLVRACVGRQGKVSCDAVSVVHHAYLRWLWTQGQHGPLSWEFAK